MFLTLCLPCGNGKIIKTVYVSVQFETTPNSNQVWAVYVYIRKKTQPGLPSIAFMPPGRSVE